MEYIFIILIFLLLVGGIYFAIINDRKIKNTTREKTVPCEPAEVEPMQQHTPHRPDTKPNPCALSTTLRIVGVANILAALIIGLVLADEFSWVISLAVILSGGLGCLFCYALAKCVDAADKYLNSH